MLQYVAVCDLQDRTQNSTVFVVSLCDSQVHLAGGNDRK